MSFRVLQLPVWQDNYAYVLLPEEGGAALVDSPEAAPVIELLEREGRTLTHIFNTHHHPDHVGSNEALAARYPGLEIWGSHYDSLHGRIPGQTRSLADGETFMWGGQSCQVREVPGHTHGHILYAWDDGSVFVGDTLFYGGCGRLFEGSAEQLDRALNEIIAALPPESRMYCAHEYTESNLRFALAVEPSNETLRSIAQEVAELRAQGKSTVPSTLARELRVNPFLRCDQPEIRQAVGASADAPRYQVLRDLRAKKDEFRG